MITNKTKRPDSTRTASAKIDALEKRRKTRAKYTPSATYGHSAEAIRAMELLARELGATVVHS